MRTPERKKYDDQKAKAKCRGIEFTLTFEEWWDIWQQSGKWAERGIRKGQYVMSRNADIGGYTLGNVKIQTVGDNNKEAFVTHRKPPMLGKHHSEETRKKLSDGSPKYWAGKKRSPEDIAKMSKGLTGRKTGRTSATFTDEWRKNMSIAAKTRVISEEGRRALSIAAKKRRHSEETKKAMSENSSRKKAINTPDGMFNSYKEAAAFYNVTHGTIRHWVINEKIGFTLVTNGTNKSTKENK
jgi:hypothetical protein